MKTLGIINLSYEPLSIVSSDNRRLRMATATVQTNLGTRNLVLWRGDEYDTAGAAGDGQYTDDDIAARVESLLTQ